jgi:iron complex outermembrane recepter protein
MTLALAAAAPARAQATAPQNPPPKASTTEPGEIVVNGIPYHETVLPTRLPSSSVYGLKLNVMDTPRNTTLLSTTQLDTLNIDDPRAFSYLTSSSYTDAAFGTPNIPRIRTQYGDLFYNGMRDSMTQNGYGVPVNFDAVSNINITKGPASVVDGPGPGVGGEVDFLTKRPNMFHPTAMVSATFDTVDNRRWVIDAGTPIVPGDLALLLSYSGEDSGSYFYGHYMRKNALYAALRWQPTSKYLLDFNTEINVEQYTEEVGVNRANQALIDHGTYLQGGAASPADIFGYLTVINLEGTTQLNPRVTIDETPGTSARGLLYNAQLIQSYDFNDHLTLENNTFFMFQDSDNQEAYYYADNSNGSYTIESRTDVKGDFDLSFGGSTIKNQFIVGGTVRFAHTNYISDFNAEAVSVWDLSGDPNTWRLPADQQAFEDAVPYKSVFGRMQYGVTGRDSVSNGNTGISDLYDEALFFQDRMEFSPQFSVLFGARIDALQDHTRDPLNCAPGGAGDYTCLADTTNIFGIDLPAEHTTGVYGLGNANISAVYKFTPDVTTYLTVDWTQSPPNPNGGEGGINAYGIVPDSKLLRGNGFLYEGGMKFNLLDNRLFISMAAFDQTHQVPSGPGDTQTIAANTYGVEIEGNYQPTRNLFATASYSYIRSILASPPAFYDFPAQPGLNIDGGGTLIAGSPVQPDLLFLPNQKVDQPDQPEHVFNFLGNYKFSSGIGIRTGLQVTGPVSLTASALVDMTQLQEAYNGVCACAAPLPNSITPRPGIKGPSGDEVGFYQSPVIPWQYTWNAAIFYEFLDRYTITFSVYNLTDQHNWQPSPSLYGNDFLVLSDPRTFEVRLQAKF